MPRKGKPPETPVRPVAKLVPRSSAPKSAGKSPAPSAPAPPKDDQSPASFAKAITGEPRDVLVTMRDHLAARLDEGVPAAYVVNVMRMLRETDAKIRDMDEKAKAERDAERGERRTWNPSAI